MRQLAVSRRMPVVAALAAALALALGAADAQALTASPNSLTFGPQTVGSASPPQSVTLTACPPLSGCVISSASDGIYLGHTAVCPAQNGTFARECVPSQDFFQVNDCPPTGMAPGSSCTMQIHFRPSGTGLRLGTVHTGYDTIAVPLNNVAGSKVVLTGTAVKAKRTCRKSKKKSGRTVSAKRKRCKKRKKR